MSVVPLYDYRIGAGFDVPLVSLANVETIKPTGSTYFPPPKAYGYYSPGTPKMRLNGRVFYSGFASVNWLFGVLFRKQFEYLQTTFCGGAGNYDGEVTIYTRLGTSSYARMNAIMILPRLVDTKSDFVWNEQYPVAMTRLKVAA